MHFDAKDEYRAQDDKSVVLCGIIGRTWLKFEAVAASTGVPMREASSTR